MNENCCIKYTGAPIQPSVCEECLHSQAVGMTKNKRRCQVYGKLPYDFAVQLPCNQINQ